MKLTPLQRRAARKARNGSMVDLNLVSLIDVFTILIFFLLSNATDVETLPLNGNVHLPVSSADKTPRPTLVVVVSNAAISIDGHDVARVADFANAPDDLIVPLKAALDAVAGMAGARPQAVTIMGDKEIPYQLLRKVMFTCAAANYANVSFAVSRKA